MNHRERGYVFIKFIDVDQGRMQLMVSLSGDYDDLVP
jgi:hypothetical protein